MWKRFAKMKHVREVLAQRGCLELLDFHTHLLQHYFTTRFIFPPKMSKFTKGKRQEILIQEILMKYNFFRGCKKNRIFLLTQKIPFNVLSSKILIKSSLIFIRYVCSFVRSIVCVCTTKLDCLNCVFFWLLFNKIFPITSGTYLERCFQSTAVQMFSSAEFVSLI